MSEHEEYTPDLGSIRAWYAGAVDEYRCDTGMSEEEAEAAFDRAIAAHDQALREQIAREIEASENELAILLDMFAENKTWASTGAEMARRIIATVAASARGEGSE